MTESIVLRPSVTAFAEAMEVALRRHDEDRGEAGWLEEDCRDAELFHHLEEEVEELAPWIYSDPTADEGVTLEAVDVGNMAMMLWDRARRRLGATPTGGPGAGSPPGDLT